MLVESHNTAKASHCNVHRPSALSILSWATKHPIASPNTVMQKLVGAKHMCIHMTSPTRNISSVPC
jgi:hypothetical protein